MHVVVGDGVLELLERRRRRAAQPQQIPDSCPPAHTVSCCPSSPDPRASSDKHGKRDKREVRHVAAMSLPERSSVRNSLSTSAPLEDMQEFIRLQQIQNLFMPVPGSLAGFRGQERYLAGIPITPVSSRHTCNGAVDYGACQVHRRRPIAFSLFHESENKKISFISPGNMETTSECKLAGRHVSNSNPRAERLPFPPKTESRLRCSLNLVGLAPEHYPRFHGESILCHLQTAKVGDRVILTEQIRDSQVIPVNAAWENPFISLLKCGADLQMQKETRETAAAKHSG